jgi:hypothetical protein
MENFLTKFTPVSSITIFTALFKRVETGEWTNKREEEIDNFIKIFNGLSDKIHKNDKERVEKFKSFGTDDTLIRRVSY